VIPPDANASFVAAMEDVLETYQRPRDADRPLVCLDETSKQLIAQTRAAIAAKPDGLKSFEAGPALGDMPTRQLGVPVLGDADQPDLAVLDGGDLGRVGRPHLIRRLGDDPPIVRRVGARASAMGRQQAMLAHGPQQAFA
jgi:hypothetical protein